MPTNLLPTFLGKKAGRSKNIFCEKFHTKKGQNIKKIKIEIKMNPEFVFSRKTIDIAVITTTPVTVKDVSAFLCV